MTSLQVRQEFITKIWKLENSMLGLEGQKEHTHKIQHEFVRHKYENGIYIRELFIPKGTVLCGKMHKYPCKNFVVGDIEVASEEGIKRIRIPSYFTSPANIKRVGYAFEDTYWTTFHSAGMEELNINELTEETILSIEKAIAFFDREEEYLQLSSQGMDIKMIPFMENV